MKSPETTRQLNEPASRRRYDDWHAGLTSRRQFLLASAGGLAALFLPLSARAGVDNPWPVLAAVQEHLFPSEPDAPGAREIRALTYLQGVIADPHGDRDEQGFLLKGVDWLEDLARTRHKASFVALDPLRREALLREVAGSEKGEIWLSNLLYYICEALLADPIYGGNPDGIGWRWLQHTPGFPRPTSLPSPFGGEGRAVGLAEALRLGGKAKAEASRSMTASAAPSPLTPPPRGEGK